MQEEWNMGTRAKTPATEDMTAGDSLSMHANVPVWCDCCTCEAEPYWLEAFENTDDDVAKSTERGSALPAR
ncbi:MAG: hypothetical protein WBO34_14300 [Gammaproteobacteria bacterium]